MTLREVNASTPAADGGAGPGGRASVEFSELGMTRVRGFGYQMGEG
jgi:hypothetical protein